MGAHAGLNRAAAHKIHSCLARKCAPRGLWRRAHLEWRLTANPRLQREAFETFQALPAKIDHKYRHRIGAASWARFEIQENRKTGITVTKRFLKSSCRDLVPSGTIDAMRGARRSHGRSDVGE